MVFADVPSTHSLYKAVQWANEKKLLDPHEKTWFGANDNATRGDLTVAPYRLAGSPKSPFRDQPL